MNNQINIADLPGSKDWIDQIQNIDQAAIEKMVGEIHSIQASVAEKGANQSSKNGSAIRRGFHAKGVGLRAKFIIKEAVPQNLRVGLFSHGGRSFNAIVRFSNAISESRNDFKFDQRGLAIRVFLNGNSNNGNVQDFLMTNTPVSFGKDARQFLDVSTFLLESEKTAIAKIIFKFPAEFSRIIGQALTNVSSGSFATERYWSRTPFQIGEYAMKYMIQPTTDVETGGLVARLSKAIAAARKWSKQNYLREELQTRLQEAGQAIKFDFKIQLYQNEQTTPIENASKEWKETDAPFATVAELEIPSPSATEEERKDLDEEIEKMAFNPWNTIDLTPLGTMNKARKLVYDQSAQKRGGCPLHGGR